MRSAQRGKSLAQDATVCVHMATDRVGVRQLRQNLSRYLRRVARGERLQVTERGKPVAVLVRTAAALDPPPLRTLAAIHLATALSLRGELGVVCAYDGRLAAAASSKVVEVAGPS